MSRFIVPDDLTELRLAWQELFLPFDPPSAASASVLENVVNAYSQVGRFYHNLAHLRQVLQTLTCLRAGAHDLPALQMAAWFHDVIYDSKARDNEERSAEYAGGALPALHVREAVCARVRELILRTKSHQAPAEDTDGHIFLDADLAILGAPEAEYTRYAKAIRQEYAWVPEDQYRPGRQQVLESFLRRQHIFATATMRNALEEQARQNLAREIALLA
jgi:predicted metal-dependent HD superfamily phosphohydrolase